MFPAARSLARIERPTDRERQKHPVGREINIREIWRSSVGGFQPKIAWKSMLHPPKIVSTSTHHHLGDQVWKIQATR